MYVNGADTTKKNETKKTFRSSVSNIGNGGGAFKSLSYF